MTTLLTTLRYWIEAAALMAFVVALGAYFVGRYAS